MHELLLHTIFYVFSALTILSAVMVVTQNNPVRCVLFLVLAFLTSSVLWLLVKAEFLALILVLVYVGAVMTLFLFVVMMLNVDVESKRSHFFKYLPFSLIVVSVLTGLLIKAIPAGMFQTGEKLSIAVKQVVSEVVISGTPVPVQAMSNTEALGSVLYTDYVFAFELAAVILLVAIIAAITLVHRGAIRAKQQNVVRQIMTKRDSRVRLIKMKSEIGPH